MQLSIVTTLYNSSPHLRAFHERMRAAAAELGLEYEIVMVDDGSPDDSLAVALQLLHEDPRLRVVELSRNFGHHRAMMTGLEHARGDIVFMIDSDLEEHPEWLPAFYGHMKATGADSVFGQQERRKGSWFEAMSGALFYRLFNALSSTPIPPSPMTARLMTREFVRALVAHREREICLDGLLALTGFRQEALRRVKGHKGRSDYSLRHKADLAIRMITSFSDRPLELLAGLGFGILVISAFTMATMVASKLFFGNTVAGYTSLVVSVWFLGGLTIFSVGLIGLYVARVLIEVKQRPPALIRTVHEVIREEPRRDTQAPTNPLVSPRPARSAHEDVVA